MSLSGLHAHQVLQRNGRNLGNCLLESDYAFSYVIRKGSKKITSGSSKLTKNQLYTAQVTNIPCGGPYTLEYKVDSKKMEIAPFFVGDIWVMAGQSNMQGVGLVSDSCDPHFLVMNYTLQEFWAVAEEPVNYRQGSPYKAYGTADPFMGRPKKTKTAKGTGPGLAFGRYIAEKYKVPIALLPCAVGGTSLDQWKPSRAKREGTDCLFGAFLKRLESVGGKVAGILWYQGCSDACPEGAKKFTRMMHILVDAFRDACGNKRLPFISVQLNGFWNSNRWNIDPFGWSSVRSQQAEFLRNDLKHRVVSAIDLSLDDGIHISGKSQNVLGRRLGQQAEDLIYSKEKGSATKQKSPYIKSLKWIQQPEEGSPAIIQADCANAKELFSLGKAAGFSIRTKSGEDIPTLFKIELKNNKILLWTELHPKDVRGKYLVYGFGAQPYCNIYNEHDLPLMGTYLLDLPKLS